MPADDGNSISIKYGGQVLNCFTARSFSALASLPRSSVAADTAAEVDDLNMASGEGAQGVSEV